MLTSKTFSFKGGATNKTYDHLRIWRNVKHGNVKVIGVKETYKTL